MNKGVRLIAMLAGLAMSLAGPLSTHTQASILTLHDFAPGTSGCRPIQPLVYATDGNLYGITYAGGTGSGANGMGTVYKMTPAGVVTNLHTFSNFTTGFQPFSLSQASDGNLYGSTFGGGSGNGVIFKLTTSGTYTLLHSFDGGTTDGKYPDAPPTLANDGNYYGTTARGGPSNDGVIYKLTSTGTYSVLHAFSGADGDLPTCQLVQSGAYLYGTTASGTGSATPGTFFNVSVSGGVFTSVHNFTAAEGNNPGGKLLLLANGNFYGCCGGGGANSDGTLYQISTAGVVTVLHNFTGTDGSSPDASVSLGNDGKLYGVASYGGAHNDGAIFQSTTAPNTYVDIHDFTDAEGQQSYSGVVQATNGYLYGTFAATPANGGAAYKSTTSGVVTVIHAFTDADAANGISDLVQGPDGSFYGTTEFGGTSGMGAIFHTALDGSTTILHSFNGLVDGDQPMAGLLMGADGLLYGTTSDGGVNGGGTAFKITTSGQFTILHNFESSQTDPGDIEAPLVQAADGNFYGVSKNGGSGRWGTFFKMTPNGTVTVLHSASYTTTEVKTPQSPLLKAVDGSFYGVAASGAANDLGAIYHLTNTGTFTIIHSFNVGEGTNPYGPIVFGDDGKIYGTTQQGGGNNYGTVYSIGTDGNNFQTLYSFTGGLDGGVVTAGLTKATGTLFYGRTGAGGSNGAGTIFSVTNTGTVTPVASLLGSIDFSSHAGVIKATDGSFYGTQFQDGANGFGDVFRAVLDNNAHNQILFQSANTNAVTFWNIWNSTVVSSPSLSTIPGAGWKAVGLADFNNDGHADLLLQNTTSYKMFIYHLNGSTFLNGTSTDSSPSTGLNVVGVGDFNGDAHEDILLQSSATHNLVVWSTNDYKITSKTNIAQVPGSGWKIVGVGDFNADGKSDILFQNPSTFQLDVWYMNGATYTSGALCSTKPTGAIAYSAISDLTSSGYPDLIFQKTAGAAPTVFHMGAGFKVTSQSTLPAPAADQNLVGPR